MILTRPQRDFLDYSEKQGHGMPTFQLTQAELDFVHHFRRESHSLDVGPARQWLGDHGIGESVLIPLLYHDQETNPRWLDRLDEDPSPPFQPAWASKKEVEARVWSVLEIYPKLKEQPFVLPGYRPEHYLESSLGPAE
jgi:hypothetical protein